ncbi:MAG: hypothetical protein JF614_10255 [Acidobacteria bacterium]|nr:hypothetical protein [Acidobacteriota bacterium]
MSKLKLRLAGLAFIALSLVALGASVAPAAACIDVVVWGTNPKTGECHEFPTPCSVPPGWTISYTGCAS